MIVIYFILGGIFTILIMFAGGIVGYAFGTKKIEEAAQKVKVKVFSQPPKDAGPVKVITPQEVEEEREAGVRNKMKGIIDS